MSTCSNPFSFPHIAVDNHGTVPIPFYLLTRLVSNSVWETSNSQGRHLHSNMSSCGPSSVYRYVW